MSKAWRLVARMTGVALIAFAVPGFYFLSLGPVGWLVDHGILPNEPFHSFYKPLLFSHYQHLGPNARRYYNWWVPPRSGPFPRARGGATPPSSSPPVGTNTLVRATNNATTAQPSGLSQ
jgi:hypothetical protein